MPRKRCMGITLRIVFSLITLHVHAVKLHSRLQYFSQASEAPPDEVAEGDGPRFAVLEVKPLMAALDMKETVMETLLSQLEVRPCIGLAVPPAVLLFATLIRSRTHHLPSDQPRKRPALAEEQGTA